MPTPARFIEASRRVTNSIPLVCPLFLPVHTVNSVQILKGSIRATHMLVEQLEYMGWYTVALQHIPPLIQSVPAQVAAGRFDPILVASLQWAGQIWWRCGDYPRAVYALETALELHAAAYSARNHHPSALRSQLLLGMVHLADSHYARALQHLNSAVTTAHQVYGARFQTGVCTRGCTALPCLLLV
jgi:hypothetical protein